MNEQQTRQEIIDKRLADAGWNVDDFTQVISEFVVQKNMFSEPSLTYGNTYSDNVLLGKDNKPLVVIRYQLYEKKEKFKTLRERIDEEIEEVQLSVNIIAKEEELIRQRKINQFWSIITENKFDELIQKIAPLMRFRETIISNGAAKFNFKDLVSEKEYVEFGTQHEALSVAKYRELLEQKVNELVSSNPLLKKLIEGKEITTVETEQLAEELHNEHPHITIDLLRRVYNHRKAQIVQFIKHILGIEILESFNETVSKAFDDFISTHNYLSSRQLQFMDLLRNYILDKGELKKRNLIESPFTLIHPQGIRGVFSPSEIDEILILTEKLTAA